VPTQCTCGSLHDEESWHLALSCRDSRWFALFNDKSILKHKQKIVGSRLTLQAPNQLLTDKTRIHLRSASVRTYTFFTTGFPRFLSIRGARGLLALNQVLI
jgi:hypothetical protein